MSQPAPAAALALDDLLTQPRPALGVFVPAGLHGLSAQRRILDALADHGADLLEIGIPHAAPALDGPVITAAYRQALRRGTTMADVTQVVEHAALRAPVVVMSYWSTVQQHGPEALAAACAAAGASGIMVVDLPAEDADAWHRTAAAAGLTTPRLVPRDLPDTHLRRLAGQASGWLYAPAATARTGYRGPLDTPSLAEFTRRLRAASALPVVSGVGISSPRLAAVVAPHVDAVVIGTPIVRALTATPAQVPSLVAEFADALHTSNAGAHHV
ncbi:tryptophan synthase subunit alpha [Streptomyces sp. NPDC050161]|uniref:tryptophan synthase subunit alpha n=1 Tax=Streptomyces sp. NPDC050161 TaxID=3365604 RepID=UPI00378DDAB9